MEKTAERHITDRDYLFYALSLVMWVAYIYLTFTNPIIRNSPLLDPAEVSDLQVRLIQLSVALPILITWTLGAFAFQRLLSYSRSISGASDEKGLRLIAYGIATLITGLLLSSFLGAIRTYFIAQDPGLTSTFVILRNYLNVLVALISYLIIFRGAFLIQKINNTIEFLKERAFFPIYALIVTADLYLLLFALNPVREVSDIPYVNATYYLPDWITLPTIIMPYIMAWGLGFLAISFMEAYQDKISGVIYKKAFSKFTAGFRVIVFSSILFQLISTLGSRFKDWNLSGLLIFIYILLAVLAIGYVLLAIGARDLKKIENV